MSQTAQPDPVIKPENSDTSDVEKKKKEEEEEKKKEEEENRKKEQEEENRKKEEEDEKKKKEEEESKKKKNKRNEGGGDVTEEQQPGSERESKKTKKDHDAEQDHGMDDVIDPVPDDAEQDHGMDDVIDPLPEDEDDDESGGKDHSLDAGGTRDISDSDGGSALTDFSDVDFEDVRQGFPRDDDPKYRASERKRVNYDLMNATIPERGTMGRFIHKIRGHCATLGFITQFGNTNILYLNQYGGIDVKKLSNRTWFRFESEAQDEEYEESVQKDEDFQEIHCLQRKDRHASALTVPLKRRYRFKKTDVISLSAAAWQTDWRLIPWEKFDWKKIGLRSFEDAKAKHDDNKLSDDHLASILQFQITHEIDQIDGESQGCRDNMMIYVRTLWKSRQFPVTWEPQSKTSRVYGSKLPEWIVDRSETNGQRYMEGVQDPSLLEHRESSVGMDVNGHTTFTHGTKDAESHTSEEKKQLKLKPISRHSRRAKESDPKDYATEFDSGSEDGGGRSRYETKKMMEMIKELSFQVSTVNLNTMTNGNRLAVLEEKQKGKKPGGRRGR